MPVWSPVNMAGGAEQWSLELQKVSGCRSLSSTWESYTFHLSLQQESNDFCYSISNSQEVWLQSLCLGSVPTVAPSLWAQDLFGNREHDLETSKQRVTFLLLTYCVSERPDPIQCEPPGLSPCPAQKVWPGPRMTSSTKPKKGSESICLEMPYMERSWDYFCVCKKITFF